MMKQKKTKKLNKISLPKVYKVKEKAEVGQFPVKHYSYSSFIRFGSNPVLFKVEQINGDRFQTTMGISGIIGQAFHKAMEVYFGGNESVPVTDEKDAIKMGLEIGMGFLENYDDGFIEYIKTVPNKQKAFEIFAFIFNSYVKERQWSKKEKLLSCEEKLEEVIDVEWKGKRINLPIGLKGYTDKIYEFENKLIIKDYKTVSTFSNSEKIDGGKMIQAIFYYLLVYAKYKKEPYSIIFEEVKKSKNKDNSSQVKSYEIVYKDNDLYFDFFFRYYEDVTNALLGKMVYVPNVNAFYDNDVAIISYIHRLDIEEERSKQMKKLKVDNITDLLKKKIQSAGNMKKLLKAVESKFVSARNLNYKNMKNHEKIQTKMLEHGMLIKFDSIIEGATIDLYQYEPSIGLKMSKLKSYLEDIEQVLGINGIRVLAPIPNTSFVGFEVPKKKRIFPNLPKGTKDFNLIIGQNIIGKPFKFDIREAPHMLIGGSSGSGKSIFLNTIIEQLTKINNTEIHLFDPKIVELSGFKKSKNVVEYETEILEINDSLESLVCEMNNRYKLMAKKGLKNISRLKDMPYKFIILDEYGDLIMQNYIQKQEIETGMIYKKGSNDGIPKTVIQKINISENINKSILLLAQKGRASGIHIIIATQRPSVDVITGTIRANFPTKVAFRTAKTIDSTILIDDTGAEKLLGKGDMIFVSEKGTERLQGYNI